MSDDRATANPGYAAGQQLRALRTLAEHPDAEIRQRALAKVEGWQRVLQGISDGSISVGSRTPVADTPAWATLEVLHGGFASGRLSAELPLDEAEQALLDTLSPPEPDETPRGRLNRYALSPQGQSWLVDQLSSGRYRVQLPEEGALAVVAWLSAKGDGAQAAEVVEAIAPYFNRLRFTPRAASLPLSTGASVARDTPAEVIAALQNKEPQTQVARMNETLRVWNPLYDRVVGLFLETVEGPEPRMAADASGALLRDPKGQPIVEGGYPMRRLPEGWMGAAESLHAEVERALHEHPLCTKPRDDRSNLGRLLELLDELVRNNGALTTPRVLRLRQALAGYMSRHGGPGSERLARVREEQARVAALPALSELVDLLIARLQPFAESKGIPDLELALEPVRAGESERLPEGLEIPAALGEKAARCLDAPIDELVELGVIPSGEVLAEVLPQLTAQVAAASVEDPALRRLYGALYGAFRRRRSLLLLNLESQVRFGELPWVAALAPHRKDDLGTQQVQRQTLEELCVLNFTAFPQTILPNPLIQELHALAQGAKLDLKFTEEVAADIFMGTFTGKFAEAALRASRLLEGSLYARYYDLPSPDEMEKIAGQRGEKWGRSTADGFVKRCQERAVEAGYGGGRWSVANNGVVLEQSQILHTHNLAGLFDALPLARLLEGRLLQMAQRCFSWILDQHALKVDGWKPQLQRVKNSAYAWRQMIFFLSMLDPAELEPFRGWARRQLGTRGKVPEVRALWPAFHGLEGVLDGQRFDAEGRLGEGRRFLGWTVGQHWLMAP